VNVLVVVDYPNRPRANPDEIANMAAYLALPLASATTGGTLRVDGGCVDLIVP